MYKADRSEYMIEIELMIATKRRADIDKNGNETMVTYGMRENFKRDIFEKIRHIQGPASIALMKFRLAPILPT